MTSLSQKPDKDQGSAANAERRQLYYKVARNFHEDVYFSAERRSRQWRLVALFGMAMGAVGLTLVFFLLPLKGYVPVYYVEDPLTGQHKAMPLEKLSAMFTTDQVRRNYWINQFITARESWNPTLYGERVKLLGATSSKRVLSQYVEEQQRSSDKNFPDLFGEHTVRTVSVTTFSHLNNFITAVRFVTEDRSEKGTVRQYWGGHIEYSWDPKMVMMEKDRLINPYGFTVKRYERKLEVVDDKGKAQ